MSLATKDISGAVSNTKGMGMFSNRERKDFRQTNHVNDIQGTTASSLLKAPKTNRVSNPLNPEYVSPGDVEYRGTMRHAMDRLGEEKQSTKDKPARGKPKFPDLTQPSEFRGVKPTDKEQLNTNRNKFYGYEGAGPSIDVNKLYQASKNTT